MTSGRKPRTPTELVTVTPNTEALASANSALTHLSKRSAEIAERYGDALPYDRLRLIGETKFLMAQSAEAMLEAGRRLIVIKENEAFGDFVSIVEGELDLGLRTAQKMMVAAAKYLSPALAKAHQPLLALGKAKLFDLMVESEDDLIELAEGGTLAGKTLDDMRAMSMRELQTELKRARQELDAKDKVIAKRDAKIAKLEEAAEAVQSEEEAQLVAVKDRVVHAQAALMQLGALVIELDRAGANENLRQVVNNDCEYLAQTFAQILVDAGVPVQFEKIVNPSWMPTAAGKKAGKGG